MTSIPVLHSWAGAAPERFAAGRYSARYAAAERLRAPLVTFTAMSPCEGGYLRSEEKIKTSALRGRTATKPRNRRG
jgi:hypothetical protein